MPTPLRLFVSNSMRGALGELVPRFERESGISVAMSYDPAKVTLARIAAGESADAVMLGAGAVAELVKQGKVKAESHRTVSRCGVGMAVLAGAPKPDIGTVEAFTRALLGARSIAYTQQGISGMHFAKLIEQLGIADAIKAKAKVQPGGLIGELVARREAEVAIQQVPELLAVPGIELVGPLPADLQLTTVSSIGIFVNAAAPQAAKAFIEFLVSPAAAKVMTAKGHEPVTSDR